MWQSKKKHTSFVKSFLHLDPDGGQPAPDQVVQKCKPEQVNDPGKEPKESPAGLVQSFFNTTSLEDDSVSLKVLGI